MDKRWTICRVCGQGHNEDFCPFCALKSKNQIVTTMICEECNTPLEYFELKGNWYTARCKTCGSSYFRDPIKGVSRLYDGCEKGSQVWFTCKCGFITALTFNTTIPFVCSRCKTEYFIYQKGHVMYSDYSLRRDMKKRITGNIWLFDREDEIVCIECNYNITHAIKLDDNWISRCNHCGSLYWKTYRENIRLFSIVGNGTKVKYPCMCGETLHIEVRPDSLFFCEKCHKEYRIDENNNVMYRILPNEENTQFESGAQREVVDLPSYASIPIECIKRIAVVFQEGRNRYGFDNWKKGVPDENLIDHAMNHLVKYSEGDKSEDHLAKVAWALIVKMWYDENDK